MKNLEKYTEEPEFVLNFIDSLKLKFNADVFPKYNKTNKGVPLFRDAESFYLWGHSPSFARILYETLGKNCQFYEDFSSNASQTIGHAIVKIGEHFYDASGIVDNLIEQYPDNFTQCSNETFLFYEEFYCSTHEHDSEIKEELITYGKQLYLQMISNHNEELTRKLVTKVSLPTENK